MAWQTAMDRLNGAYAPATLRAYRSDYMHFEGWCQTQSEPIFPTSPSALLSYVDQLPSQTRPSTIRRRVIAVARLHILSGFKDPADNLDVALALRRRFRRHGVPPEQAYGLTRDRLQTLLDTCDDNMRGLRDRAMLLVGFEALCRRSELIKLAVDDISISLRGAPTVIIHETKSAPVVRRRLACLSRTGMDVLGAWLAASGITSGPVFRPIYHETVINRRICGFTVVRVLKERARTAGLEDDIVDQLSGHSLRVGAAQELAIRGHDVAQIMRAGGWKSLTSLSRYIEGAMVNVWDIE